jgi:hypothetical protein
MTNYNLNSLRISRDTWRQNSPLRCTVEFAGSAGKIEIDIGEETTAAVLAVVADQIVAAAAMRAADMKAAFVEGAAQAQAKAVTAP